MLCDKCGKETMQNANYCQHCGSELSSVGESDSDQIELSSVQPENNHDEQIIEQPKKHESVSFIAGAHHPWRRFFARTVDLLSIGILIFLLFSFSIVYLFPQYIDVYAKFIENPIVAPIVLYVLWVPVEALFLSFGGTTPAKWIFGIRVTSQTGENLSYGESLKRGFLVFIQGEGFGIPLAILFTRLFAYRRLTRTGTTLWDTSVGSVVTHRKWGVIRAIASIFVTLLILVNISILNQMGNSYG